MKKPIGQPKKPELRSRVDALLDSMIVKFYKEVPFSQHMLNGSQINMDYYKRHNIETILRLRLKRTVDALAIRYFTKHDPVQAKAWAKYTEEEMLHDTEFFVRDLEAVGVSKDAIYSQQPMLSTKLLMGYLLFDIEYKDSPMALISSVYFVEYTTVKTQPQWLDNLAKILGKDKIIGARGHVNLDLKDDHDDFVWDVLVSLIKTPEDEEKVLEHIRNVGRLYVAYFMELHQQLIVGQTDDLILGKSLDMSVLAQVS
ncbi:MAG: hypothetical protein V7K89_20285 [Nostoc sp.]|uniref:hypothetical protein n=1 Tax=Nostoc sp. TaxID=1180 RepID=UPI002FF832BB